MGHYLSELNIPTDAERAEIERRIDEARERREEWARQFVLWVAAQGPTSYYDVLDAYEELCEAAGMNRRQRRCALDSAEYLLKAAIWRLDGREIEWGRAFGAFDGKKDITITGRGRESAPGECPGLRKD